MRKINSWTLSLLGSSIDIPASFCRLLGFQGMEGQRIDSGRGKGLLNHPQAHISINNSCFPKYHLTCAQRAKMEAFRVKWLLFCDHVWSQLSFKLISCTLITTTPDSLVLLRIIGRERISSSHMKVDFYELCNHSVTSHLSCTFYHTDASMSILDKLEEIVKDKV